ncbi:NmrA family NAD(P)-binding protein [Spirillospora sp. NPDC127200]
MSIAIIGATGRLGGLTIDALIERSVPVGDILAPGRNTERLAALAQRGLRTTVVDLDDVPGTAAALTGVDKLLWVSMADRVSVRLVQPGTSVWARSSQQGCAVWVRRGEDAGDLGDGFAAGPALSAAAALCSSTARCRARRGCAPQVGHCPERG